jgi:hypothetical protein
MLTPAIILAILNVAPKINSGTKLAALALLIGLILALVFGGAMPSD